MENSVLMGRVNGPSDSRYELRAFAWNESLPLHSSGQILSIDQPHAEVVLAPMLTDLVNGHDVRMVQVSRRLGFGAEALDFGRRGQSPSADHLESHQTFEANLASFIDDPHPAPGNFFDQLVVAEITETPQPGRRRVELCTGIAAEKIGGLRRVGRFFRPGQLFGKPQGQQTLPAN